MSERYYYFAPCPRGLEEALEAELAEIGGQELAPRPAGVAFRGDLEVGYRACLWCRLASRILLELDRFPAPNPEALYAGARDFPFEEHFTVQESFAVEFTSTLSAIKHTNFGALKVKDAIADRFRDLIGVRPSVDRERPDIRFHMHIHEEMASLSLDLSGERLHRRSWRAQAQEAPLKENLAAGMLRIARWPAVFAQGGGLVDPMCGSGTLLVEAALMALDVAPGLLRQGFGFERWQYHHANLWSRLVAEAKQRDLRGVTSSLPILGSDSDEEAVEASLRNLAEAGIRGVAVVRRELAMAEPVGDRPGILVTNPPYGIRLGVGTQLDQLYRRLGMTLKGRFQEWTGFVLTGNLDAAKQLGLRVARRHLLFNGAIECRMLEIPILPARKPQPGESPAADSEPTALTESTEVTQEVQEVQEVQGPQAGSVATPLASSTEAAGRTSTDNSGAAAFGNRVRKNLAALRKWREREGVSCFRVYDADLPEYALTIDQYEQWVHIQESERPATIDPLKAESRLHDALAALPGVLGVPPENLFVKQRFRQRGNQQYGRFGSTGAFHEVSESGLRFLVNFTDYFDSGLFLDHRPVRRMIREMAEGKHFLNLFAYTGSATVYAAAGGARTTTTLDLSKVYLDWARRNMELNGFGGVRHSFINEDAMEWLKGHKNFYDLVFLDPPTFSNSKSMRGTFDVQRDHAWMIREVMRLLSPDGTLIFSNNFRKFLLDEELSGQFDVQEITRSTIPPDFARDPKAHRVFLLRKP